MLIGYARVLTTDQKPELQVDALLKPSSLSDWAARIGMR